MFLRVLLLQMAEVLQKTNLISGASDVENYGSIASVGGVSIGCWNFGLPGLASLSTLVGPDGIEERATGGQAGQERSVSVA